MDVYLGPAADPLLVPAKQAPSTPRDYHLQMGSPAVNAGVTLPDDWPDPLRPMDRGKPDIGALPLEVEAFQVGRTARR